MKKTEKMILIACIVAVSFLAFLTGKNMYDSKAYFDKFEMKFEDVAADADSRQEIYIAELRNFKAGEYSLAFDYNTDSDVTVKVMSYAGYDHKTDSLPVFLNEKIAAGSGSFSGALNFESDCQAVTFTVTGRGKISLTDCKVISDSVSFADRKINFAMFLFGLALFTAVAVYTVINKTGRYDVYTSLFVLYGLAAAALVSNSIYMFRNYSTYGCDTKFHLFRTKAIAESMLNGNIPNRINGVSYFGYGYANPLLYPELFLYIPALWMNKGMSDLGAIKLFYILLGFVAVYVAYYSFEKMCHNRFISFSAAVIYNLSFYKLVNVYVRTALGETLFMTFLPLAVYRLYTFFYEEKRRWLLLALSVSAIVQSQILGVLLTCIILGILFVVFTLDLMVKKQLDSGKVKKIITDMAKAVGWTFFANLWFIVPFLNAYINYGLVMFDREKMVTWFFNEVLSAENFLSATIMPGDKNVFSAVGPMVLVGLGVALVLAAVSFAKAKKDRPVVCSVAIMAVFMGVICTDFVNWHKLMSVKIIKVLLTTLQFSFRFETLFVMSVCLVIVLAARTIGGRKIEILSAVLTLAVILTVLPNMKEFADKANFGRVDNTYRSYGVDEPLEYLKPGADVRGEILLEKKVTASENISVTGYTKDGINIDFSVETDGNKGWVQLPRFYYDDYYATAENGQRLKVYSGDRALMYVEIPENMGSQTVSVRFGGMMYDVCLYISLAFLLACSAVWGVNLYRKKEKTE